MYINDFLYYRYTANAQEQYNDSQITPVKKKTLKRMVVDVTLLGPQKQSAKVSS